MIKVWAKKICCAVSMCVFLSLFIAAHLMVHFSRCPGEFWQAVDMQSIFPTYPVVMILQYCGVLFFSCSQRYYFKRCNISLLDFQKALRSRTLSHYSHRTHGVSVTVCLEVTWTAIDLLSQDTWCFCGCLPGSNLDCNRSALTGHMVFLWLSAWK